MKYFYLPFLFIYLQAYSQQEIRGTVFNGDDNSKLISASVFIDNSSKGTMTDVDGKFIIAGLTESNFELVVSYTGFTTVSIRITPQNINQLHTIRLFPRKRALEEIYIMAPEKDGWKNWGALFKEQFIGVSRFAAKCSIKNPEVILFFRNKKTSALHAYSKAAIIIENKELGYNIKYNLENFIYDPKNGVVFTEGYNTFEDLGIKNKNRIKTIVKNRQEAYKGSILHFMRALYRDIVNDQGFDVREQIRVKAEDSIFNQIYKPSNMPKFVKFEDKVYAIKSGNVSILKKIPTYIDLIDTTVFSFKKATSLDSDKKQKTLYFQNYLAIIYKKGFEKPDYLRFKALSPGSRIHQRSEIILLSDEPVVIKENGLYFNPLNLLLSGYMAWHKLAEALPSDYIDKKQ